MLSQLRVAPARAPRGEGHIAKTDEWLAKKFDLFNRRYFDGSLPTMPVHFRGYRYSARLGSYWHCPRGITINGYQSEQGVLAVLLHEMVHAQQAVEKRKLDHGKWFKARCRELTAFTKGRYGKIR